MTKTPNQQSKPSPGKESAAGVGGLKSQIVAAQRAGHPYYVYTLSDEGGVFYVGKGQRWRLFAHGTAADGMVTDQSGRLVRFTWGAR